MTPAPSPDLLERNLWGAIQLLHQLQRRGLRHLVLAPGSRSAPLAVAAGLLESEGLLQLHPCLDERSGAFLALGLARAEGVPAAVVTTSGSAVANLLPAAVEADHGTLPLLLLSADRPARLKRCGANQAVNQEQFLAPSCRWFAQAPAAGLAELGSAEVLALADQAWEASLAAPPGPVHLNLPFEEPLHGDGVLVQRLSERLQEQLRAADLQPGACVLPATIQPGANVLSAAKPSGAEPLQAAASIERTRLDADRPGLIIAGPWRGRPQDWALWRDSLRHWQQRSGWPVLADPLSCLRGDPELEVIVSYDLILEGAGLSAPAQVLRLGPLPASRRLQRWLESQQAVQVLVTEGESRPLDPLRRVQAQSAAGLVAWVQAIAPEAGSPAPASLELAAVWRRAEAQAQALLSDWAAAEPALSEPLLAHHLSRLLPPGVLVMLANSSPVRDWESFAAAAAPPRPLAGFRGASGIDGTLSEACGLALGLGEAVLISGDLALLHDSNGWLWHQDLRHHRARLTVVVLDNGGGGIFEQLPIRPQPEAAFDFERLFAMGQPLDPTALAAAHGVPVRQVTSLEALAPALHWAREHPLALLRLVSDRRADARLRQALRTRVSERLSGHQHNGSLL